MQQFTVFLLRDVAGTLFLIPEDLVTIRKEKLWMLYLHYTIYAIVYSTMRCSYALLMQTSVSLKGDFWRWVTVC